MLKTWTDTHYKLAESDWLYIAKHDEQSSASLVCPGYARDGQGFSIHFSVAHIELLEQLTEVLRGIQSQLATATEHSQPAVEMYAQQRVRAATEQAIGVGAGSEYAVHPKPVSTHQPLVSYPVGREK